MASQTPRRYSKRNRPVRSCTQCVRRKQKCDRQLPCRTCLSRGVGSNCSYDSSTQSQDWDDRSVSTYRANSHSLAPTSVDRASSQVGEALLDRLGYSQKGDHALSALGQLLHDDSAQHIAPAGTVPELPVQMQNKFWEIMTNLPSYPVIQALVGVFFEEANWYFAVLDQSIFDVLSVKWNEIFLAKRSTEVPSLELYHFSSLLFQVLALALQFLPSVHSNLYGLEFGRQEERDKISAELSDWGEKLMTLFGRRIPTTVSIQADLMHCAWLKNEGRGTEAWLSMGNAVRQAQAIDLHRQSQSRPSSTELSSEGLKALWFEEHRRRLWVTIFVWESHMSLQLGRPRLINLSDCTCADPIDCDFPLDPSRTLLRTPQPDDPPSSYTLQLVKYRIGQFIHRVISIGATNPLLQDYGVIQSLHNEVLELIDSLPPAMQLRNPDPTWEFRYPGLIKQRLQISIVVYSFLVALHRPHALRHSSSRQHAVEAALQSLNASNDLFELCQPHHYKIYTLVFHTIDSGILLAAVGIKYWHLFDHALRRQIEQSLAQAVHRLSVLKSRNTSALYGEKALSSCLERFLRVQAEPTKSRDVDDLVGEASPTLFDNLSQKGLNTQGSPRAPSRVDERATAVATNSDPSLGRDLFEDITNSRVSTTSWLEHMDMMSRLDVRFEDSDLTWDGIFL